MSQNKVKVVITENKTIKKPEIVVIGKNGKIVEKGQKSGSKIEDNVKSSKTNIKGYQNIFSELKELNEISKSELYDEIINPDLQYFLTFCCFLYLLRGLHMMYRIFDDIDRKKLNFDLNYEFTIFLVDIFFTVVVMNTAIIGFLFFWKMYSWFVFPYLMSLFFSSFLMGFRIIAPIIDDNYSKYSFYCKSILIYYRLN